MPLQRNSADMKKELTKKELRYKWKVNSAIYGVHGHIGHNATTKNYISVTVANFVSPKYS